MRISVPQYVYQVPQCQVNLFWVGAICAFLAFSCLVVGTLGARKEQRPRDVKELLAEQRYSNY